MTDRVGCEVYAGFSNVVVNPVSIPSTNAAADDVRLAAQAGAILVYTTKTLLNARIQLIEISSGQKAYDALFPTLNNRQSIPLPSTGHYAYRILSPTLPVSRGRIFVN
jgi:hypothetical protein